MTRGNHDYLLADDAHLWNSLQLQVSNHETRKYLL